MTRIAIIGAGLAGLTAANILNKNFTVTVFEKSRGIGGRMATRRADPYAFDHGAQFFTARGDEFKKFITPMLNAGVIQPWPARFVEIENKIIVHSRQWDNIYPHYVGVPSMNAIPKKLSIGLDIHLNTQVKSIISSNSMWDLKDDKDHDLGVFDWIISATPVEQALNLLPHNSIFYQHLSHIKMQGCYSLMLGLASALPIKFDAALVRDDVISWIAVNNSKPGRNTVFCLMINSTNAWAEQHIEDDHSQVMQYLIERASKILDYDLSNATHKAIHKWRFANIAQQNVQTHYIDTEQRIAACGDWCIKGRVEAAFQSGFDMGNNISKVFK